MTEQDKLFARFVAIGVLIVSGVAASLSGELCGSEQSERSIGAMLFIGLGVYLVFDLTRKEEDEDSTRGPDDPTFGNGG